MTATPPHRKRFGRWAILGIPGTNDDGTDAWWYVLDRRTNQSIEIGQGPASRDRATDEARQRNKQGAAWSSVPTTVARTCIRKDP